MKLLLDVCVWPAAAQVLRERGHDVILVSEIDNAMSDARIMEWACQEGRTIVTLDKDFGQLAVLHGQPHCGIVRLVDLHPGAQAGAVLDAIDSYGPIVIERSLITISKHRWRIRETE
ncbi:DUF5615 family PIN-like protein [bacterium]|nr:DUF5615 family PIN-like protein [bacterium]